MNSNPVIIMFRYIVINRRRNYIDSPNYKTHNYESLARIVAYLFREPSPLLKLQAGSGCKFY